MSETCNLEDKKEQKPKKQTKKFNVKDGHLFYEIITDSEKFVRATYINYTFTALEPELTVEDRMLSEVQHEVTATTLLHPNDTFDLKVGISNAIKKVRTKLLEYVNEIYRRRTGLLRRLFCKGKYSQE